MRIVIFYILIMTIASGRYFMADEETLPHDMGDFHNRSKPLPSMTIIPRHDEDIRPADDTVKNAEIPEELRNSRGINRASKRLIKKSPSDVMSEFKHVPIGSEGLLLIENYRAERIYSEPSIRLVPGHEIVRSDIREAANLIFDKNSGKYGIWTREIILEGNLKLVEDFVEIHQLVRVGESNSIYQVTEEVGLDDLYTDLPEGLKVRPDLKYPVASSN